MKRKQQKQIRKKRRKKIKKRRKKIKKRRKKKEDKEKKKEDKKENKTKKEIEVIVKRRVISLDPGVRVFMTGLSEDEVLNIGKDCTERIKYYINIQNCVRNITYMSRRNKSKKIKKINKKINFLVDDLHWKSISYLTKKYDNILIGDMGTISIVSSKMPGMPKHQKKMLNKLMYKLKFYQFRQRLQFKCNERRKGYKKVNERYTSKICSRCGNCKEHLGPKKIYDCEKCELKTGRDINGCRGIFITSQY